MAAFEFLHNGDYYIFMGTAIVRMHADNFEDSSFKELSNCIKLRTALLKSILVISYHL